MNPEYISCFVIGMCLSFGTCLLVQMTEYVPVPMKTTSMCGAVCGAVTYVIIRDAI